MAREIIKIFIIHKFISHYGGKKHEKNYPHFCCYYADYAGYKCFHWNDEKEFFDFTGKQICTGCLRNWEKDAYIYNCRCCEYLTIIPKELVEKYPYLRELVENEVCPYPTCEKEYETSKLSEEVA